MDKNIALYLDDIRTPTDLPKGYSRWEVVRNFEEFKSFIEKYAEEYKELPPLISFDHDLHTEHYSNELKRGIGFPIFYSKYKNKTGKQCIEWLCDFVAKENLPFNGLYVVHSENEMGNANMEWYLEEFIKINKFKGIVFKNNWKHTK